MKGVIWTDVFQTVVMIGGLVAIVVVVTDCILNRFDLYNMFDFVYF